MRGTTVGMIGGVAMFKVIGAKGIHREATEMTEGVAGEAGAGAEVMRANHQCKTRRIKRIKGRAS